MNDGRSEEHTSELQSRRDLVCRLLLEKKTHARLPVRPRPDPRESGRASPHRRGAPPRAPLRPPPALAAGPPSLPPPPSFFFLKKPGPPETYPLPLPDAFPI